MHLPLKVQVYLGIDVRRLGDTSVFLHCHAIPFSPKHDTHHPLHHVRIDNDFFGFYRILYRMHIMHIASCGVRTHAQLPAMDLKSTPLATRANLLNQIFYKPSNFDY